MSLLLHIYCTEYVASTHTYKIRQVQHSSCMCRPINTLHLIALWFTAIGRWEDTGVVGGRGRGCVLGGCLSDVVCIQMSVVEPISPRTRTNCNSVQTNKAQPGFKRSIYLCKRCRAGMLQRGGTPTHTFPTHSHTHHTHAHKHIHPRAHCGCRTQTVWNKTPRGFTSMLTFRSNYGHSFINIYYTECIV